MSQPILPARLRGAVVIRQGRSILGPLDLTLEPGGAITVVIGPNGSGKTTLLRVLHGLERMQQGSLRWSAPQDIARAAQGFVFQTPTMMRRSVIDSIAYPLRLLGVGRRAARAQAAQQAVAAGIGHVLDSPAPALSGGEKQKLALARVLIRRPQVLFLDEPCANLDGSATAAIEALLQTCRREGTRIVMSTHDMGQARRLADDMLFLHNGRIAEQAPADRFFAAPASAAARAHLRGDLLP
ncbi:ATP-binding cassette domain-containing protein [Paracoccus jiaweipingae]|uniref:ATP-binding cassette domain-containing protein n=1 Tax=unclassified Paracoccus (in: a-proteobacteria) TaxID=2688777 RepID=UPI0037B33EB1